MLLTNPLGKVSLKFSKINDQLKKCNTRKLYFASFPLWRGIKGEDIKINYYKNIEISQAIFFVSLIKTYLQMQNNDYNTKLKNYARVLRTESVSKAEKYIWKVLLSRKQLGVGFKRQRPISNFIVDFYCQELCLIVEIDGNSHLNKGEYDFFRENKLKELGNVIVRFSEGDVLNNLNEIKNQLSHFIYCLKEIPPPHSPSGRGKLDNLQK
jgi:very-short-patch-repair endonuclease